jgi:membrane associated rhomboid family serine protease
MDTHPITLLIIAANVLVSLKGFNDPSFFDRYSFKIGAIRAGQRERLFTSAFLHVDMAHLFLNLFTLYFFAEVVIYGFGPLQFLLLYGLSLLSGSFISLVFHRKEPHYTAVGASGAVTGILYAAILLQPEMRLAIMFIPIPLPAYVLGIAYLFYSIYGMKNRTGNIGHAAHFGGAIGGYLSSLALRPVIILRHPGIVVLLAMPILIFFLLRRLRKI